MLKIEHPEDENPHDTVSIVLASGPNGLPLLSVETDSSGNHLILHAPNGAPRVRLTAENGGGFGQFTDERGMPLLCLSGPFPSVDLSDPKDPAGVFLVSLNAEDGGGRVTLGANTEHGAQVTRLGF